MSVQHSVGIIAQRPSASHAEHLMHSATATTTRQKETGAYFTPPDAVSALVKWAARRPSDRLLDPSCGDGRFIALHPRSVGVEQEADLSRTARERAPGALIHEGDFFTWAMRTTERFECAAGKKAHSSDAGDVGRTARLVALLFLST